MNRFVINLICDSQFYDRRECNEIIHNSQHFIFHHLLVLLLYCQFQCQFENFSIVCKYICCVLMPFSSPNCGNKTRQHCKLTRVQFYASSPLICFCFFVVCFQSSNYWLTESNRTIKYLYTHYRQDINCINQFNIYLWWFVCLREHNGCWGGKYANTWIW